MNWFFTLGFFDYIAIGIIVFSMNLTAVAWIRLLDRNKKRQMMENFLSHIQQKIQTEEEFQDIIDKMRRDFGGEPSGNN